MTDTKYFAGGFEIIDMTLKSCIGTKARLDNVWLNIRVYEDMFGNFMTGDITIADDSGLYDNLPIIGEETLTLIFQSKGFKGIPMGREFHVYKISNLRQPSYNYKEYTIHFAAKEFKVNRQTRVSKSYMGMRTSDIVYSLMTEPPPNGLGFIPTADHELACETTLYPEHFISPYWHPMDAINWLTARAQVADNPEAVNFHFFNTREGYYLLSLETMLKLPERGKFVYNLQNYDSKYYTLGAVNKYQVIEHFNSFENHDTGAYASKLTTYDIVKKEIKEEVIDYLKDFKTITHLEKNPRHLVYNRTDYTSKFDSVHRLYPKHFKLWDNIAKGDNRADEWLLKRKMQLNILNSFRMIIECPGNTKHTPGDVVEFDIYQDNPEKRSTDQVIDKYYSGRYIITAVCHNLTRLPDETYISTIEMAKDSVRPIIGK